MRANLIGKVINNIMVAADKNAILFQCLDGDMVAVTYAECCSDTWIEHVELPALGFPATVIDIGVLDLPGSDENHPEHGWLQVYGFKLVTNKGDIIIDYRNASNGYYGGDLSFKGEYGFPHVERSDYDWQQVCEE